MGLFKSTKATAFLPQPCSQVSMTEVLAGAHYLCPDTSYRDTLKVRSAQSAPPLASRRGPAHETASALSVCAASVCSGTSARRSHSLTLRSNDAVATWCGELGCQAAAVIQSLCEANARMPCAASLG